MPDGERDHDGCTHLHWAENCVFCQQLGYLLGGGWVLDHDQDQIDSYTRSPWYRLGRRP